ncbi:SDR family NAD(P)-dependent oxidoreductase [Actinosynnema sp. CS-041913]|uniref:SDR family NAD(P)-dependent oxidoreductase n=1 Tax=Actinosynnema sp. CS-041913 TaxID=3239917 RepID=UPI003D927102
MIDVKGRVAFLTGAAEGLGREIARELVAAGMRVALMDVQGEKLAALTGQLRSAGGDVLPLVVDLADPVATQDATEAALAHYGPPRALIHNAAVLKEVSMSDVTFEDWRREVDIILGAAYVLTRTVWPHMVAARDGSIVFLSSGSALSGFVKETAYTPGKHAQEGLMKVLALEGREHNVAVNTMSTGRPIDTPMSDSHYTEEMRIGIVPPSRLAPAFAFLAGIDADFATGHRFNAFQMSEAIRVTRG